MTRPTTIAPRVGDRARLAAQAILTLLIVTSPGFAGEGASIPWREGYEPAEAESRASGRSLWIQFTGPWCPHCRRMDRDVLSRPDVSAILAEGFVPVKVRSDEREDLIVRYQVYALPAMIVVDSRGRVLMKHEGYSDPGQTLGMLETHRSRPAERRPEIALAGYDPVTYVRTGGLEAGKAEVSTKYDGREYRFRDPADLDSFLAQPERFLPVNDGRCVVNRVKTGKDVNGDPRFGVYYRGHLYLLADEDARKEFAAEPERFAQADVAEQGFCPHCGALAGTKVPGKPQYSAIHRGLRYLFPDELHRQAFRLAPDRYVR